jgi:hypothetical protein
MREIRTSGSVGRGLRPPYPIDGVPGYDGVPRYDGIMDPNGKRHAGRGGSIATGHTGAEQGAGRGRAPRRAGRHGDLISRLFWGM